MSDSENSRPTTPPPAPPAAYPPPGASPQTPGAYPASAAAYPPPPPGYAPPAYGPPAAKTNTLAIVSFICAVAAFVIVPFIGSIAGVILGHISLHQLRTSGEQGRGFALAGTIVGWVGVGFGILGIVLAFAWFALIAGAISSTGTSFA